MTKITSLNLSDEVYEWLRVNVRNRSEFVDSLIRKEMTAKQDNTIVAETKPPKPPWQEKYLDDLDRQIAESKDPDYILRLQRVKRTMIRERDQWAKRAKRAKRARR